MRREAVSVLRRILPLAAVVGRAVRTLGLVGLGAAVVIALVVLVRWTPGDGKDWAGFVVLCALLAVPPAVLLAFSLVLGEVSALPDKLRSYPETTREHATRLRAIARDAQARERPAWRRLPGSTWRLATLARSARDLLAPHAPLLPLLRACRSCSRRSLPGCLCPWSSSPPWSSCSQPPWRKAADLPAWKMPPSWRGMLGVKPLPASSVP